jgi:hypothetical protein
LEHEAELRRIQLKLEELKIETNDIEEVKHHTSENEDDHDMDSIEDLDLNSYCTL